MEHNTPDIITQSKKIFFFGIGGMGISAIARMMIEQGKTVIGQDISASTNLSHLEDLGASISIGQDISAIPVDTDIIVYSRAIEILYPDFLKEIKQLDIPSYVYPEMLGIISKDLYTIAIAGAHGKTTTTGMMAHTLGVCGKDPTVVIGSFLQGSHSNFIQGKSNYFVVEADEYHRAFLHLYPQILIITNIDLDHVDYYKDIDDVISAYKALVEKIPSSGYVVCDSEHPYIKQVIKHTQATIVDYRTKAKKRAIKIPGNHMQFDAACVAAGAHILGITDAQIDAALETFPGTWKRFEYKGKTKTQALVYDDFAHHPTEITATLQGFRELYQDKKIVVIFQPHLFSRTKALFSDFAASFTDCDEVIVLPIYVAREKRDDSITSDMLAHEIEKASQKPAAAYTFDETKHYVESQIENQIYDENTVIVTMGAGDAYTIGEQIAHI